MDFKLKVVYTFIMNKKATEILSKIQDLFQK